jgi:hypothetical protein
MKVRALPTWRNPVGEGAKRTRGLGGKVEVEKSDITLGLDQEKNIPGSNFKPFQSAAAHLPIIDGTGGQNHRQPTPL